MPRLRPRLRRVAALLVLGAAGLLAAWHWLLPALVHSQIVTTLHEAGLHEATLGSVAVEWRQTVLRELALAPEDGCRIAEVVVTYDAESLRAGRVRTVILRGLRLRLDPAAPPKALLARLGGSQRGRRLPCDALTLTGSTAQIRRGNGWQTVKLSGTAQRSGKHWDLRLAAASPPLHAEAQARLDEEGGEATALNARVRGLTAVDLDELATACGHPPPLACAGPVTVTFTGHTDQGLPTGTLLLQAPELAGVGTIHNHLLRVQLRQATLSVPCPGVLEGAAASLNAAALAVEGAGTKARFDNGSARLSLGPPGPQGEVTFASGSVTSQGFGVPLTQPRITLAGQTLRLAATGTFCDHGALTLQGTADWTGATPTGAVTARLTGLDLGREGPWQTLLPALARGRLHGTAAATLELAWQDGRLGQRGTLTLNDAGVALPARDIAVEGVNGTLDLTNLTPPATAPAQTLTAQRLRLGKLKATDGQVTFALDRAGGLAIRKAECAWAGGRLRFDPVAWQRGTGSVRLVIAAEALDLQQVLDAFEKDRMEGKGTLAGQLPVTYNPAEAFPLSFEDGFLEARPQTGWLRFSETDAMLILGLDAVKPLEQASHEEIAKLLALQALRDFAYRELRCDFANRPGRGWVGTMVLRGAGPQGSPNPTEIGGLTVTHNNLDDWLNLVIFHPNPAEWQTREMERDTTPETRAAEDSAIDAFF